MGSEGSEVGAAAAPAVLQGRNSVVSINSNYNESGVNAANQFNQQRAQPQRAGGGP